MLDVHGCLFGASVVVLWQLCSVANAQSSPGIIGGQVCTTSFADVGGSVSIATDDNCVECQVSSAHLASDNDPNTFAEIIVPAAAGTNGTLATFRFSAIAPANVTLQAGLFPGFWVEFNAPIREGTDRRSLLLRDNGVESLREVRSENNVIGSTIVGLPGYAGINSTSQFDEIVYQREFTLLSGSFKIFEVCADK